MGDVQSYGFERGWNEPSHSSMEDFRLPTISPGRSVGGSTRITREADRIEVDGDVLKDCNRPAIILGLTGYARSGKDSAAQFLVDEGWKRLAFADAVRDAVHTMNPLLGLDVRLQEIVDGKGWDYAKTQIPEIRRLLQVMGTEVGRMLFGENVWVDIVDRQIEDGGRYVITDVRFENEVKWLKARKGTLIRIERPGVQAVNAHVSDTGIASLQVDDVIMNNGTLADLRRSILDYT